MEPEDQMVLAPIPLWGHRAALSSWGIQAEEDEEAGLIGAEGVVAGSLDGSQDPALRLGDGFSRRVHKYLEATTFSALGGIKASSPVTGATTGG